MPFQAPPDFAAWQHREARDGFEVVFSSADGGRYDFEGTTGPRSSRRSVGRAVRDQALDPAWAPAARGIRSRRLRRLRAHLGRPTGRRLADRRGDGAPPRRLSRCRPGVVLGQCVPGPPARPEMRRAGRCARGVCPRPRSQRRAARTALYTARGSRGQRALHYVSPGFEFECETRLRRVRLVLELPGIAIRAA